MLFLLFTLTIVGLSVFSGPQLKMYTATDPKITYHGRIEILADEVVLISPASYAQVSFTGDSCVVEVNNLDDAGRQNYIVLELDGMYLGRLRINGPGKQAIPVNVDSNKEQHLLKIFKADEAQMGSVSITAIKCRQLLATNSDTLKTVSIEFIGDSHTSGEGINHDQIPCSEGVWGDQHNAYLTYSSLLARKFNARYIISSVSGIGIYRTWNGIGPVMREVYENLYFNLDTTKKYDFKQFTPDIVSICLGTNDFSNGDGINPRKPFSEEEFTRYYIAFIEKISGYHPQAKFILISSATVVNEPEKNKVFLKCLKQIQSHFNAAGNRKVEIFEFPPMEIHGCNYHPDAEDHKKMAQLLQPLFKKVIEGLDK